MTRVPGTAVSSLDLSVLLGWPAEPTRNTEIPKTHSFFALATRKLVCDWQDRMCVEAEGLQYKKLYRLRLGRPEA